MCGDIINNLYKILRIIYFFYYTQRVTFAYPVLLLPMICLLKLANYTSPFSNSTCYIMYAFGLHTSGEIFTKISVATTK